MQVRVAVVCPAFTQRYGYAGKPLTIADRMKNRYLNGFSGKWHLGLPQFKPSTIRGLVALTSMGRFMESGSTNLSLDGKAVEHQSRKGLPAGVANRVILQGKYGESFITPARPEISRSSTCLYAPHPSDQEVGSLLQEISKLDYPHYDDWRDDRRRMGLALIKSIDDAWRSDDQTS